MVLSVTASGLL